MTLSLLALSVVVAFPQASHDGHLTDRQIEAGLGVLPAELRADAQILEQRGEEFVVRREGTNAWTCRIRKPRGDRLASNCYHRVLEDFMNHSLGLVAEGLRGDELRERLGEDLMAGRLLIPPGSMEISGSGVIPEGEEVPEEMTGYYFLYYPFSTASMMGVSGEDPQNGEPWLHHGGTAEAHLMWTRSHRP